MTTKRRLNDELCYLKNLLSTTDKTSILKEISIIEAQLQKVMSSENEGLVIRAKMEKQLLDERCTQYFLSRIKEK